MKQYTYDAFISYRHAELDKFAAENLHRKLEAFRLPGNVSKNKTGGRTRINRVFRDRDELPLTSNLEDPIRKALEESEYLIVICSPRLRESLWCKKEIETFISMHGREKVLAVLIEGEPEQSFPEELLYYEETVQDADGTVHTIKREMEPLAADIRGKNCRAMKKAMRTEMLRILAPMFSVSFDDLRQRHKERRMKRILAATVAGAAVCLAFGTISTAMALRIRQQKDRIEEQNIEIQSQSEEIRLQNEALLQKQAVTLAEESMRKLEAGDRIGAIETARHALTEYEGNAMPYTPEAQYALTESLRVYDRGMSFKPQYQLETEGEVDHMTLSPDREKLVTYDTSACLTVWDLENGTVLGEIRDLNDVAYAENDYAFLDNNRLVYLNEEGEAAVYDVEKKEVTDLLPYTRLSGVYTDPEGKYLLLQDMDGLVLLDAATFEEKQRYVTASFLYGVQFSQDNSMIAFLEETEDGRLLHFWNPDEEFFYTPVDVADGSLQQVRYRDDTAYALLNYSSDDWYRTESTLFAYNLQSNKILWERKFDSYGEFLLRPYAEGGDKLFVAVSFEGWLINEADGSEYVRFPYGNTVAGCAVFLKQDRYLVFTRGGEFHTISVESAQDYYVEGLFLCHSGNVKLFKPSAVGYLVVPFQDNHVTIYDYSIGEDVAAYDGEWQKPEKEVYIYSEAVAMAKERGLKKAALAKDAFYNEDGSLIAFYYSDNTLEIYGAQEGDLKCALSDLKGEIDHFVGTDRAGNLYVAGTSYGYMLSPGFEMLGSVEGLCGVDAEGGRMILQNSDGTFCTVPIYTVEELLAKAEAYVLR